MPIVLLLLHISDDGHYRVVKLHRENAGYKRGQLLDFSIFHREAITVPPCSPLPPFPTDTRGRKGRKIQLKLQITIEAPCEEASKSALMRSLKSPGVTPRFRPPSRAPLLMKIAASRDTDYAFKIYPPCLIEVNGLTWTEPSPLRDRLGLAY